jgi:hypothetical protein
MYRYMCIWTQTSVADSDPSDSYVFEPPDPLVRDMDPNSFYHQVKIAQKTLIPTVM